MRITQLYSKFSDKFRREALAKFKMNNAFIEGVNYHEPLLVIGCYDIKEVSVAGLNAMHSGLSVIYWCGTDANRIADPKNSFSADMLRDKRIKHIASSKWIAEDLTKVGFDFKYLPVCLSDLNIKPEPLGDSIYMYKPNDNYYSHGIYQQLKEVLPYKFIESTHDTYTEDEILELYKNSFIGLRFTEHDGLSETVAKMGLMGRRVIHNDNMPNCIPFDKDNIEGIINEIHNEFKYPLPYKEIADEMYDYLNVGDEWLNTEWYG